jgi:hypothetical protein
MKLFRHSIDASVLVCDGDLFIQYKGDVVLDLWCVLFLLFAARSPALLAGFALRPTLFIYAELRFQFLYQKRRGTHFP